MGGERWSRGTASLRVMAPKGHKIYLYIRSTFRQYATSSWSAGYSDGPPPKHTHTHTPPPTWP